MDLTKFSEFDVQSILEDALGERIHSYGVVMYVPPGKTPEEMLPNLTHVLTLRSIRTGESLNIAIGAKSPYDRLVDIALLIL